MGNRAERRCQPHFSKLKLFETKTFQTQTFRNPKLFGTNTFKNQNLMKTPTPLFSKPTPYRFGSIPIWTEIQGRLASAWVAHAAAEMSSTLTLLGAVAHTVVIPDGYTDQPSPLRPVRFWQGRCRKKCVSLPLFLTLTLYRRRTTTTTPRRDHDD